MSERKRHKEMITACNYVKALNAEKTRNVLSMTQAITRVSET